MKAKLEEFLAVDFGFGSGSGSVAGAGTGSGTGYGSGYGYGSGHGSGSGSGTGYGYGSGHGSGYGSGTGDGDGAGSGAGSGFGGGIGNGTGYKSINGHDVHQIDGLATMIDHVRGNVARGSVVLSDLTLKRCYVVKVKNCFAHGETLAVATRDAEEKAFRTLPADERVDAFLEHFQLDQAYKAEVFMEWHRKLTGSCQMGVDQFVKDRQIARDTLFTVQEFIGIVEGQYGSEVIKLLEQTIGERL